MEEIDGCSMSKERYLCLLLEATSVTFHIDMCRGRLTFTLAGQCGSTRVYFNNPIGPACVNKVHDLIQLSYCGGKDTCTNITPAPTTDDDINMGLSQAIAHKVEGMVRDWAREDLYIRTQGLIYASLEAQERVCK